MVTEGSTPAIRHLTLDDLDDSLRLSSTAGWNQQHADWQMLLTIAPTGSFGAIDHSNGQIVGTAIGIHYESFGWIAMMLVDPAYRGRGLGARLLEAAMNALPADIPIRLDATPMGRPLYQRFGFADETMLTRHVAAGADRRSVVGDGPVGERDDAHPLERTSLNAVASRDRDIFGGNRRVVLEWALQRAPQYARVLQPVSGSPQYCFGRQGRLFDQIGPIVADDDDSARALLVAAMRAAGERAVVVDAFDEHKRFANWLRGCGFRGERPLYRMCRPITTSAAHRTGSRGDTSEFAIFGPEFG
jgi:GNAT superfamily N-acetyltransferase